MCMENTASLNSDMLLYMVYEKLLVFQIAQKFEAYDGSLYHGRFCGGLYQPVGSLSRCLTTESEGQYRVFLISDGFHFNG